MPTTSSNVTINQLKCTTCQNNCANKYYAEYETVTSCNQDPNRPTGGANAGGGSGYSWSYSPPLPPGAGEICDNADNVLAACTNACTSCKNN